MDGSCLMCMTGDDDYWVFYNEHHPRARREQTCGECRRSIARGERYWTQGGLTEDGGFEWHKTCEHCTIASRWLEVVCHGWIFDARQEDFLSHVIGDERYIRSRPLVRLVRWMVADWRDRTGELRPLDDVQALTNDAVAAYQHLARAVPA
jgi:hypothetical protein